MAFKIATGQKDLLRSKETEPVKQKKQTFKAAGLKLKVGYRQAKRIYAAYLSGGDAALVHGNTGKRSNRKIKTEIRDSVLRAYRERYDDFGPAFAAGKPAEVEGIKVSASTMRRRLPADGLWSRKRQSGEYRGRRDRRESFGELIQFDGSRHRRFEDRGTKCCLITLIDGATNTGLSQFFEEETTAGATAVLKLRIKKYGIPQALYRDKKNVFALTREPTDAELLNGITKPKSRFGKARGKPGIEVIAANSPQAKGRVGRNHALDQDRLVKELRLAGISTIEDANKFLLETCLPKINAKFSRPAKSPIDAHIPLLDIDLRDIFCFEYERAVTNGYVVRFECRLFQLLLTNKCLPRPKDKVTVRIKIDNTCEILWKGKPLLAREITPKKKEVIVA